MSACLGIEAMHSARESRSSMALRLIIDVGFTLRLTMALRISTQRENIITTRRNDGTNRDEGMNHLTAVQSYNGKTADAKTPSSPNPSPPTRPPYAPQSSKLESSPSPPSPSSPPSPPPSLKSHHTPPSPRLSRMISPHLSHPPQQPRPHP